ncbi:MAG TPA: hypothetical protein VJN18_32470 [Polyangiaceae bacterium]|nr:hypothetical protein [Polyangiaceae bacterium]
MPEGALMLEVKVRIYTCAGVAHYVCADVEKLGPGRYELAWCDLPALYAISLTGAQLHYLRRRCEEAYDVVEREREELGIEVLLDDTASAGNHDRDYRLSEVA